MPTRKIKAAEPEQADRGVEVVVSGRHQPLRRRAVEQAVRVVLEGERSSAAISISFVGPLRMRRLNLDWKGEDRPTDVLAFPLTLPSGARHGDVYVCRAIAAREARSRGIPLGEELARLVIHGTLHVVGYDHPEGSERTRSPMWRRQERYLGCLG